MLHAVTAAEMRELDRATIEDIGIPGAVLMETAGRRVAGAVLALDDEVEPESVVVVCGGGNNGGDGYVCARVLREHGINAVVFAAVSTDRLGGDAAVHARAYRECGGIVIPLESADDLADAAEVIEVADVVVDAVFGTGLARVVEGHLAQVIDLINTANGAIVACDVPSGLDADSGRPLGVAVIADLTVTMAFAKVGLISAPGFEYVGELQVVEIGIPTQLGSISTVGYLEPDDVAEMIPWPRGGDHKGRRGHVLVLAGSPGQRGAARLAATAALRSGAGLVTWASPSDSELDAPDPVMSVALDARAPIESWLPGLLEGKAAVVLGPGMDKSDWGRSLVDAVLGAGETPLLVDADALNHLAGRTGAIAEYRGELVMTPHPGEAGRLLSKTAAEVQADRLGAARTLGASAVTVLKGARTIVADERFATINGTGNAGMATAGAGDVLGGVIGALLAQGLDAGEAARLGVYLHGLAGDIAAGDLGPHSLTAVELIDNLGEAFGALAEE